MINLGEYSNEVVNKYKLADHPTGSNYICDPPVTDTDVDWVVLVTDWMLVVNELSTLGWDYTADYLGGHGDFTSIRRGEINLILVQEKKEFDLWVKATEEAKKLNLLNKQDRIDLFTKVWEADKKEVTLDLLEEKYKLFMNDRPYAAGPAIPRYIYSFDGALFGKIRSDFPEEERNPGWKPEKIPTPKKRKTVAAYLTNLLGVMRA